MNKYQEAFKRLVEKSGFWEDDRYGGMDETNEDEKTLQELVDRATPKKPINMRLTLKKNIEALAGDCPICGHRVDEIDFPYMCSRKDCGQWLEWRKE